MKPKSVASVVSACGVVAGVVLVPWVTAASEVDHEKSRGHAVFGRGLNTNQAGNPVNHVVLPQEIKIKAGGVVDFAVAGFHDIVIFKPGFTLEQLIQAGNGQYPTTQGLFVIPPDPGVALPPAIAFLTEHIYYRGLNPAGGPLGTAVTANPSNIFNRSEPVAFLERGTYLVICNVRPHLLDGMYSYVKVD
jgi:plastocyanin